MKLDTETATQLGWNEVLKQLAELARTPQGKATCLALKPSSDPKTIAQAHQRHRQLTWLLDQGLSPPIEAVEEVEPELIRAEKGGVLSAEEVQRSARAMYVSSRVRGFLMREGDRAGAQLVDIARPSHDLLSTAEDLAAAFEPDGRLRDSASVELRQLRRQANSLADGMRQRLEKMVRSNRVAAVLSEPYVTQRADRYVLPVRADSRGELEGIVHDTSLSGATVFIEPAQVVGDGNRLKIARAAVAEEERRILAGYSREIAERADDLRDNLRMLAQVDALHASVLLGQRLDGHLPEVQGAGFDLRNARHPLMVLAGDPVVTNDIHLPAGRRALVVTGPNAGGKTVVLKTLGLCCLMAQAAVPIPAADGSRIGLFASLDAVIGDFQDISRGLSTFSAHIQRIGQILDAAAADGLVLLDELAADTDPRQGTALAAAILERLVEVGATVLVTTHYEELKQLPYQDERFANASVGFDLGRMEPTFALHPDVPGRSLTLDIGRRLGLDQAVLQRAAQRLDVSDQGLEQMLDRLEDERQHVAILRAELSDAKQRFDRAAEEHRGSADRLEQRHRELLGQGREKLLAEIASVRREVAEVIESLRQAADMKRAVDSSHRLIQLEGQLRSQARSPEIQILEEPRGAESVELRPGDRVRLLRLAKEGVVCSVDRAGSMLTVRLGSIHTRVPVEQVERLEGAKSRGRRDGSPVKSAREPALQSAQPTQVRTSANTLDLRGRRVDEALAEADRFLDRLFTTGETSAFLIHGHGTGALKAAVREYLRSCPYPRYFRVGTQEEGGDGVTVVTLK